MPGKLIFETLSRATDDLANVAYECARQEAEILLCHCLGISKSQLLGKLRETIPKHNEKQFQALVQERSAGVPLAYITKETDFFGRKFWVNRGVLIPRPETELVVEHAIARIRPFSKTPTTSVLELGTGTGIISISLALTFPQFTVASWDISKRAYLNATNNATFHQAKNLQLFVGDFFAGATNWLKKNKFSNTTLVANPPYIHPLDWQNLDPSVKNFEPKRALVGGKDGLVFYRRLATFAIKNKIATVILEIGIHQKSDIEKIFSSYATTCYNDYKGIPRIFVASRRPGGGI